MYIHSEIKMFLYSWVRWGPHSASRTFRLTRRRATRNATAGMPHARPRRDRRGDDKRHSHASSVDTTRGPDRGADATRRRRSSVDPTTGDNPDAFRYGRGIGMPNARFGVCRPRLVRYHTRQQHM